MLVGCFSRAGVPFRQPAKLFATAGHAAMRALLVLLAADTAFGISPDKGHFERHTLKAHSPAHGKNGGHTKKDDKSQHVMIGGGAWKPPGAKEEKVQGLDTTFHAAVAKKGQSADAQRVEALKEEARRAIEAEAYYRDVNADMFDGTPLTNEAAHSHKNWSFAFDPSEKGVYVHWKPQFGVKSAPLRDIFWVHVPKTASSFSRTIFSYACGPNSFPFGKVWTGLVPKIEGDCGGTRSQLQAGVNHSWFHMPVPPQLQATGRGVVMMLRPPRQRLLSAAGMIELCSVAKCTQWGCGCMCCAGKWDNHTDTYTQDVGGGDPSVQGDSWGWSKRDRQMAIRATRKRGLAGYMDALSRKNALTGCYAKMMNGIGCNEDYVLTSDEVKKAAHFVEHKASFVGLTNRFEESVCLFHAMYGGLVYHFETKDFVMNHGKHEELHDEGPLGNWQDAEDDIVFAAASRKFADNMATHYEQVNACMRTVNKWVAEDWNNGVYEPSEEKIKEDGHPLVVGGP